MGTLNATIVRQKCQGHGVCLKTAPEVFRLDAEGKVQARDAAGTPDEILLAAARGCPYRAILVTEAQTGAKVFPRVRS